MAQQQLVLHSPAGADPVTYNWPLTSGRGNVSPASCKSKPNTRRFYILSSFHVCVSARARGSHDGLSARTHFVFVVICAAGERGRVHSLMRSLWSRRCSQLARALQSHLLHSMQVCFVTFLSVSKRKCIYYGIAQRAHSDCSTCCSCVCGGLRGSCACAFCQLEVDVNYK